MKAVLCRVLLASGVAGVCLFAAKGAGSNSSNWSLHEEETIQKTLPLTSSPMRVVLDNLEGYVHVTGTDGSEVKISAHKVIRAETDSDMQQAKNEVKLEISENGGTVNVYYDAPWRCNGRGGDGCHGNWRRFYDVKYDLDVQVPRNARMVVSTVNGGDIEVNDVSGDYDVHNVNGAIKMSGIGGSGDAHTVNGPVTVHFLKNPSANSTFKSVNGALDAFFKSQLSADLAFKTMNGEIYSDFDVTAKFVQTAQGEREGGKYVYRSNRMRAARAGSGGPELSFETLNGNIRLHREE